MPELPKKNWFRVGKPLDPKRGTLLVIASFLFPLLVWCFVSYAPFLWDVDYRFTLTATADDKQEFGATYGVGDTLPEDYFLRFQEAIREDNTKLRVLHQTEGPWAKTGLKIRRDNKNLLFNFEPILVANDILDPEVKNTMSGPEYKALVYRASYETLAQLSSNSRTLDPKTISEENLAIAKRNGAFLTSLSPTYDSKNFFSQPLLKFIPEGEKQVARPSFIPAPHTTFLTAWDDFTGRSELGDLSVWKKYRESLRVVFYGFFIACLIGIPLALLAGTFSFFSRLFEPFADFFRYMPAPAFSTVLIAIFDLALAPKVALIVLGTLPHLILMVANTTRTVEPSLLDAAQTLGAKNQRLVARVVIPAILPSLYNDLRILLGWAWTWLVIAELIGAKSGLTEIIDTQGRRFNFEHVYPVIFLIGLTGFLTDQFLGSLRSVIFPWTATGPSNFIGKLILIPVRFARWLTMNRLDPITPIH